MRIHGAIATISPDKVKPQTWQQLDGMAQHLTRFQRPEPDLKQICQLDFHYTLENVAHFRVHIMRTHRDLGIVARVIPQNIPSFDELRLPPVVREIANYRNGLILVAGATGSGKSTTMAALLNHIIQQRPVHAVTLEDFWQMQFLDAGNFRFNAADDHADVAALSMDVDAEAANIWIIERQIHFPVRCEGGTLLFTHAVVGQLLTADYMTVLTRRCDSMARRFRAIFRVI